MIIQHQKGSARYLSFPMISTSAPETFLTGLSVADAGYYKDGAGAWTALAIADSVSEIGSTGMYEIDLSGAEMNHDQIMIKFTATGAADVAVVIDTRTRLAEDLNNFDPSTDQVIVATNNDKTGYSVDTVNDKTGYSVDTVNDKTGYSIAGTLTTLDALDTAQDAQHTTTQGLITGLSIPTGVEVADAVLTRNLSNVEVGLGEHTLGTICLMGLESVASGGTLTIYRTDGVTTHVTKTLTSDPAADPVVGVS